MKETDYTRALVRAFQWQLKGCVVFKHTDSFSSGIPDLSVTWAGRTTWLEAKVEHAGVVKGTGVQANNMKLLALAGLAYYVVYSGDIIKIVEPNEMRGIGSALHIQKTVRQGVSQAFVVNFIRELHLTQARNSAQA